MSSYVIRSVRAEEWRPRRSFGSLALQDPVAHLAFLETYEEAVARPDSFWQERAAGAAEGASGAADHRRRAGRASGSGRVTVLVEEAGTTDWAGFAGRAEAGASGRGLRAARGTGGAG